MMVIRKIAMDETPAETKRTAITQSPATRRPRRLTRGEKGEKIKADLLRAAARIVGKVGYQNAMVSKITDVANVSQGTFYNYFESRQELFDQLLPSLGKELIDHIRTLAGGAPNAFEREKRSFVAFFEFMRLKPEFYRILYEAEIFAPRGYKLHVEQIAKLYVRTLEREAARGEITLSNREGPEAVAYMLMGARHYLCMRFARKNGRPVALPEGVLDTYLQIVSLGLYRTP
jgi:AcrR family transcriptional regulator